VERMEVTLMSFNVPAGPTKGQLFMDSNTNRYYEYTGKGWKRIGKKEAIRKYTAMRSAPQGNNTNEHN